MTNSFAPISRRALALIAFAGLSSMTACVSTGSVEEQQALTADILQSKTAQIVVHAADPDWQKDADELKLVLADMIQAKGWWTVAATGDVTLDITFDSFDKGSKGMRMMNLGGEAELAATVVIEDASGSALAKLRVTGNSTRTSTVSVGGYDTSWGDSLPGRAVRALAEQIVEYVESKHAEK